MHIEEKFGTFIIEKSKSSFVLGTIGQVLTDSLDLEKFQLFQFLFIFFAAIKVKKVNFISMYSAHNVYCPCPWEGA